MKKGILSTMLLLAAVSGASAQDYDKVSLSYDNTKYAINASVGAITTNSDMQLNGLGVGYVHGFGVHKNLFVEAGANLNFLAGSKNQVSMQNFNATIPVNVVYSFPITKGVTITPYAGLNAKANIVTRGKANDEKWANYHDGDAAYNRFQAGWQAGFRINYDNYFLGVEYGTDFIPACDKSWELLGVRAKTNAKTSGVKLSVGLTL